MTTTPAPTLNRDAVAAALRVIGDHRRVRNVRGCTGCDWTPRNPGYASDPAATARRHHQFNTHLAEAVTAAVTEALTAEPSDLGLRARIEALIGGPTPPVLLSDRPNKIHRVQHRDDRLGATVTQSMVLVDDITKALEAPHA